MVPGPFCFRAVSSWSTLDQIASSLPLNMGTAHSTASATRSWMYQSTRALSAGCRWPWRSPSWGWDPDPSPVGPWATPSTASSSGSSSKALVDGVVMLSFRTGLGSPRPTSHYPFRPAWKTSRWTGQGR